MKRATSLRTLFVDTFTDGTLDPEAPMLGPVVDGGFITANTSPGCWGPMITPAIRGGHELTQPVAVEGAEVGDAIAIRVLSIEVTSAAAASGVHTVVEGRYEGNPYIYGKCPQCGKLWPQTHLDGIGETAVRCSECGAEASPFGVAHGYTMVFDNTKRVGVTLTPEAAQRVAQAPVAFAALPDHSAVHPFLVMAPADLPLVATRLRPFMGQLGTIPSIKIPGQFNAGDAIQGLVGGKQQYCIAKDQVSCCTDAHMDCDAVRAGSIIVCPVKVAGGGVYLGDLHAMQGDGEIAGHTTDVSGLVTLQVHVIKGLTLDGPVLLPLIDDLPPLARPLDKDERAIAEQTARAWGIGELEISAPISVIGSGRTINAAVENGLSRAAGLLGMSVEEVRNRATITGSVEVARLGGVAQITFLVPLHILDRVCLGSYAREAYDLRS